MQSASTTTASLLQRVAAGDAGAVHACLDRYGRLVAAMARRWFDDEGQVEDVVQEVFVQVWRSAHTYDPAVASERTWIATIARRRLIDHRRKLGSGPRIATFDAAPGGADAPESPSPDEPGAIGESALQRATRREESRAALDALAKLDAAQRGLLVLSIVEGRSHGEIATLTGLPLGTVKTRLRAGLARLRTLLGAGGGRAEVSS